VLPTILRRCACVLQAVVDVLRTRLKSGVETRPHGLCSAQASDHREFV
jgi:hypothetical protein